MSNLPFWKFAGLLLLRGGHDGVTAFGFLSWGLWACSSKDTTWWTAGWYDVVPCGNKTSTYICSSHFPRRSESQLIRHHPGRLQFFLQFSRALLREVGTTCNLSDATFGDNFLQAVMLRYVSFGLLWAWQHEDLLRAMRLSWWFSATISWQKAFGNIEAASVRRAQVLKAFLLVIHGSWGYPLAAAPFKHAICLCSSGLQRRCPCLQPLDMTQACYIPSPVQYLCATCFQEIVFALSGHRMQIQT